MAINVSSLKTDTVYYDQAPRQDYHSEGARSPKPLKYVKITLEKHNFGGVLGLSERLLHTCLIMGFLSYATVLVTECYVLILY